MYSTCSNKLLPLLGRDEPRSQETHTTISILQLDFLIYIVNQLVFFKGTKSRDFSANLSGPLMTRQKYFRTFNTTIKTKIVNQEPKLLSTILALLSLLEHFSTRSEAKMNRFVLPSYANIHVGTV